jgi:hypothetical protein
VHVIQLVGYRNVNHVPAVVAVLIQPKNILSREYFSSVHAQRLPTQASASVAMEAAATALPASALPPRTFLLMELP